MSEVEISEKENFDYDTYLYYDKKTEKGNKERNGKYSRFETIKDVKHTDNGLVAYIEHSTCPECEYPIKYNNPHSCEVVCEQCGTVLDQHILEADSKYLLFSSTEELPENNNIFKKEEKRVLDIMHNKKYANPEHKQKSKTPKKDWHLNQYYFFAKKVSKEFNMSKKEVIILKNIIKEYKMKQIHSCLKYEVVIVGICLYILRNKGYVVSYKHEVIDSVKLTKMHYKVIKRNLDRLAVLK